MYLQVVFGPLVLEVGQRRELQVQRLHVLRVQRHARRQPRALAAERQARRVRAHHRQLNNTKR